jgi:hypothetical protein
VTLGEDDANLPAVDTPGYTRAVLNMTEDLSAQRERNGTPRPRSSSILEDSFEGRTPQRTRKRWEGQPAALALLGTQIEPAIAPGRVLLRPGDGGISPVQPATDAPTSSVCNALTLSVPSRTTFRAFEVAGSANVS